MEMETPVLLHDAEIVTSGDTRHGSVAICNGTINDIIYPDKDGFADYAGHSAEYDELPSLFQMEHPGGRVEKMTGKCIMAGGIDAHVHFRDPGLTHKADFGSESKAALIGGVTSVIDMPNTVPPTTSIQALEEKLKSISGRSRTNFGLHIGATNSNAEELLAAVEADAARGKRNFAGIKVFMGSSTGDMLVDDRETLNRIFAIKSVPILVHCEDEATVKANLAAAKSRFGENIPFSEHPSVRSRRACILSTIKALELAIKYGTRLHLCHISTKEEVEMARAAKAINRNITVETSINYLWFCESDYKRLKSRIKCNPAIKSENDRAALVEGIRDGIIDTVGTDHAPHLLSEKGNNYCSAPSGIPSIQHCLPALLTVAEKESLPLHTVSAVFSSNAAKIFGISGHGKIEKGQSADLVVFDKNKEFSVRREDIAYKCGWSPYEGYCMKGRIESVYLAGKETVKAGKISDSNPAGEKLSFLNFI